MQQIFTLMNQLLRKDHRSKKRGLKMRTYRIIPMTGASGLLEFCQGTLPIGVYLTEDNGGAHGRYHPEGYSYKEAVKKFRDCQNANKPLKEKHRVFQDICKNFPPVFGHFFWERFKEPSIWYEKRLSYTRSVATSSMVGYILGLGDRHLANIDFGIAFEQGQLLPIPETIPFRLTRDIIDPMGITGVDGVFQRCAEVVLDVMRKEQQAIHAILDVILLDPMSTWTLTPSKRLLVQRDNDDVSTGLQLGSFVRSALGRNGANARKSENAMAASVTLKVTQKLNGRVTGDGGQGLSVEGQVRHLIQEARDPVKLCSLFV